MGRAQITLACIPFLCKVKKGHSIQFLSPQLDTSHQTECCWSYSGRVCSSGVSFQINQKLIDLKHVGSLEPQEGTELDSGSQPGPPTWCISWAVKAMSLKGLRVIHDVCSFFKKNSKAVVTRTKQRYGLQSLWRNHQETLHSQGRGLSLEEEREVLQATPQAGEELCEKTVALGNLSPGKDCVGPTWQEHSAL